MQLHSCSLPKISLKLLVFRFTFIYVYDLQQNNVNKLVLDSLPLNMLLLYCYWLKYLHEVLAYRLGGLSLPRKSVVRLTDCPAMTLAVYHGRKTIT